MIPAVGSTGTGGGAKAIEFGKEKERGSDKMDETDVSYVNLTEYDGLLRTDTNILKRDTTYAVDNIVNKGLVYLKCKQAGKTDTTTLSLANVLVGSTLQDGTVSWEVISINGVPASSSGDIPIATSTDIGGVKSSSVQGEIKVNTDGTMSVNPIQEVVDPDVGDWTPNTQYKANILVRYDDSLYMCLQEHTSSTDFVTDLALMYWSHIDKGAISTAANGYLQLTKLNVTASTSTPKEVLLSINPTKTFCLPKVEVLKFKSGQQQTITSLDFNNSDSSSFTYNTDYVEFDGTMHLRNNYSINMSVPQVITDGTTTGYVSESDNIDFSTWQNVEEVYVGWAVHF